MRTQGSAEELEARRRIAGKLLLQGEGVLKVAKKLGVAKSSVSRWKKAVEEQGLEGLKSKPHPGKPPRLSPVQRRQLIEILQKGPVAAGYRTDLWTCRRVAEVIERQFGVSYHPDHVWRILRQLGWSCQKPEHRAREQDPQAAAGWRKQDWPRIKKSPQTKRQHRFHR